MGLLLPKSRWHGPRCLATYWSTAEYCTSVQISHTRQGIFERNSLLMCVMTLRMASSQIEFFFVCKLLGYVSRPVCPSISWAYTKRTIQNRHKNNQFQWPDQRKTNSSNKFEDKLTSPIKLVKDEKPIPESSHRRSTRSRRNPRRAVIGFEIPWQERASDTKIGGSLRGGLHGCHASDIHFHLCLQVSHHHQNERGLGRCLERLHHRWVLYPGLLFFERVSI